jgi:hypothetical protein
MREILITIAFCYAKQIKSGAVVKQKTIVVQIDFVYNIYNIKIFKFISSLSSSLALKR